MTARLHALRGFGETAGHTDPHVSAPAPLDEVWLDSTEGAAHIDTRNVPRWRGQTEHEVQRLAELRERAAEDMRANRISLWVWLLWAAIFVGTLVVSHYVPACWGCGWTWP